AVARMTEPNLAAAAHVGVTRTVAVAGRGTTISQPHDGHLDCRPAGSSFATSFLRKRPVERRSTGSRLASRTTGQGDRASKGDTAWKSKTRSGKLDHGA